MFFFANYLILSPVHYIYDTSMPRLHHIKECKQAHPHVKNKQKHTDRKKNFTEKNEKSVRMFCRFQKKLYLCTAIQGSSVPGDPSGKPNLMKKNTFVGEVAELVDALL